ncbi:TOBE domain-containing protein [Paucibacter soli]|uniref:TOBE domain-containing protein n=1 Tax=Paucibacter soli TaxID=3133433 RepID=UPI0030B37FE8
MAVSRKPPEQAAAAPLRLEAGLHLSQAGQALASPRQLALLTEIDRLGSLTRAAKAAGYSYKGAWNAIEQLNNLAGEPLLERRPGGKGGGYTRLTARGAQLLRNLALIQQEHERFVARLNSQSQGLAQDYALAGSIALRTSARNQFAGTVCAIRGGAVNDEIELAIIGGQTLVATVTRASREELGLTLGSKAFALIKASSVLLMTGTAATLRLSARNQLQGQVLRVNAGAVNCEVLLALPGGGTLAAIVTQASAESLGLAMGMPATAVFKASSVILAVAA